MARKHDAKSYLSEALLASCFKNSESKKLMKVEHGNALDEIGLREFLREFEDCEEVINLIKELNMKKMPLPDFILKDNEEVFFAEIKTKPKEKKVKLSDLNQKNAIKRLAENGFEIWVIIDRTDYGELSDLEINDILKENGEIMKGIYPKEKMLNIEVELNYSKEKGIYKNVFMVDVEIIEVRLKNDGK